MKAGTYTVSSGFGPRDGGFHYGLDFAAKDGTPIYAAQGGTVQYIGAADGFGQWIVIDHPTEDGSGTTVYGHMWDAFKTGLKQGQRVEAGQLIAYVGTNGQSTGPHLHFEVHPTVWRAGSQIDPKPWLAKATAPPAPQPPRSNMQPNFIENNVIGNWRGRPYGNSQGRGGQRVRYLVLHTSEGAGGAGLLDFMQAKEVSYHDVVDDTGEHKATIWHLVDKNRASWSVGNGNDYTINYCFGTSFAKRHNRADWLRLQDDSIQALAWQVAQDCHTFGIPPIVRVGGSANGYASLRGNTGITDHRGINTLVGGDHTDVGEFFPWDVFNQYLQQYYAGLSGDDELTPEQDYMLRYVFTELSKRFPSRSIYASPEDETTDTFAGFALNIDGMDHADLVEKQALDGDADSIMRIKRTAAGKGKYPNDQWGIDRAKRALAALSASTKK